MYSENFSTLYSVRDAITGRIIVRGKEKRGKITPHPLFLYTSNLNLGFFFFYIYDLIWVLAKYPPPFLHAYEDVVTPNIIESLGVCAGIYPFNFRVMVPLWVSLQNYSS